MNKSQDMLSSLRILLVTVVAAFLQACAVAPIATEVQLQAGEMQVPQKQAGKTYVLLYNNANKLLYGIDNTARLNVWLDGKGIGGLDIGQYVQMVLPNGEHVLKLLHRDVLDFESTHRIALNGEPLFIEMYPTPVSNSIAVHGKLPTGNDLPKPFVPYRP